MEIDKEVIDKLLAGYKGPEDLIGEQGLLKQLTKALVERAMSAELSHHLGYEKHDGQGRGRGNARNGASRKTLKGDFGQAEIAVPRDRNGTFTPQIVAPHQRRFTGFDDKILSMYARGMTTREIHRIIVHTAVCGRRQGSPLRCDEHAKARALDCSRSRPNNPLIRNRVVIPS